MQVSFRATKPLLHYGILAFFYTVGIVTLASHTVLHALEGHHGAVESQSNICLGGSVHTYDLNFTTSVVSPDRLTVSKCDQVVVRNNTKTELIAAIGPHSHHIHYPGFVETVLEPGQTYGFRATESGTFLVHDHDDDRLTAILTVREQK